MPYLILSQIHKKVNKNHPKKKNKHIQKNKKQNVANKLNKPIMQDKEFYSKKYNIVHYHTAKCGATTMNDFLQCNKRIPIKNIPSNAKILCIVRNPVSRFISGFLYVRKTKLNKGYKLRNLSPQFTQKLLKGSLIDSFEATIQEIEMRGAFDTHLQSQECYLGSSATIQDKFSGKRDASKVTYWVPLEYLNQFCETHFNAVPKRLNSSDNTETNILKSHIEIHPELKEKILKIYKTDAERYFKIIKNYNN